MILYYLTATLMNLSKPGFSSLIDILNYTKYTNFKYKNSGKNNIITLKF